MEIHSVILAAGQGTRMRSNLPKVMHPLLGRPLIWYSVESARQVSGTKPVVVVGHGADEVRKALGDSVEFVCQDQQLGTGHALWQAEPALRDKKGLILVTYADMPLLTSETLKRLVEAQQSHTGPFTLLTIEVDDPRGFGRVLRGPDGFVREVVEEAQATLEQQRIKELNAGVYCFSSDWVWTALPQIPLSPKGEYYLTDLVGLAVRQGKAVKAITTDDPNEAIGINTRVHLAEAGAVLQRRINKGWMLAGVTIADPASTYIEPEVKIGQDTVILPNTHLQGTTEIGEACEIGPNAIIRDTKIGSRCTILASVMEGAVLEDEVDIGPFGHLRKGAHLATGVHMGNFGEVKNSYLGPGTKMGHFSYLGDATIEQDVNIGAGTITCNYDGKKKHPTHIGKGVFIGSDTMLVAPVNLGEGARTGAGAVVTKDVPEYTLVVGVPARPLRKVEKDE